MEKLEALSRLAGQASGQCKQSDRENFVKHDTFAQIFNVPPDQLSVCCSLAAHTRNRRRMRAC